MRSFQLYLSVQYLFVYIDIGEVLCIPVMLLLLLLNSVFCAPTTCHLWFLYFWYMKPVGIAGTLCSIAIVEHYYYLH